VLWCKLDYGPLSRVLAFFICLYFVILFIEFEFLDSVTVEFLHVFDNSPRFVILLVYEKIFWALWHDDEAES